ncbi:hypothetical protein SEA_EVAA_76 [Gordonia phage Evaa]|nr:hypothetical protein SEA_EVAA_76 [Gordonia phage Evaa]
MSVSYNVSVADNPTAYPDAVIRSNLADLLAVIGQLVFDSEHECPVTYEQISGAKDMWAELERRRRLGIATMTDRDHETKVQLAIDVNPLWLGQWVTVSPAEGTLVEFQLVRYQVDSEGVMFARDDTTAYRIAGQSPVAVNDRQVYDSDTIEAMMTP